VLVGYQGRVLVRYQGCVLVRYQGRVPQQSGWRPGRSLVPWGSRRPHRFRPPGRLSGCPLYWDPPQPGQDPRILATHSITGALLHITCVCACVRACVRACVHACVRACTCVSRVHQERGVGEGGPGHQAVPVGPDPAGLPDLRLDHQDGQRTVGDVLAALQDADAVLAHLPRDEGDACRGAHRSILHTIYSTSNTHYTHYILVLHTI